MKKEGRTHCFVYDDANQINDSVVAAGRTTYTFNANGNQPIVLEPDGDSSTTMWDYENRPTLYELPSTELVTLTDNADNTSRRETK